MKKIIVLVVAVVAAAYVVGLFATKVIHTEVEIAADHNMVWQELVAFEDYPEWNPFIKKVAGELVAGARLDVTIQPPGKSAMDFSPELLVVKAGEELRWKGKLLLPGLFDGEHYLKIEEIAADRVRLIHGETFTGVLALLLWNWVEPGTRLGFQAMNDALKQRVEGGLQQNTNKL